MMRVSKFMEQTQGCAKIDGESRVVIFLMFKFLVLDLGWNHNNYLRLFSTVISNDRRG